MEQHNDWITWFIGSGAALLLGGIGAAAVLGRPRSSVLMAASWPAGDERFAYRAMEAERDLDEDPRLEVLQHLAAHDGTAAREDLTEGQWNILRTPPLNRYVVFRRAESRVERKRGDRPVTTDLALLTPEGQQLAQSLGVRGARVHPLVEEAYGVRSHGLVGSEGEMILAAHELGVVR